MVQRKVNLVGVVAIIVVVVLCCVSNTYGARLVQRDQPKDEKAAAPELDIYGKWCGPNHGGFQDCCDGEGCPSCVPPKLGQFDYTFNNAGCLTECPPKDDLDWACAWHDMCCFILGTDSKCFTGQSCFCNCVLNYVACQHTNTGVCTYFRDVASCWFCNDSAPVSAHSDATQQLQQLLSVSKKRQESSGVAVRAKGGPDKQLCDSLTGDADYALDDFCADPAFVLDRFKTTGQFYLEDPCYTHTNLTDNVLV